MKFAVAQLGARMHYAVPRQLHRFGMLARLYTDICSVKGWPRLANAVPTRFRPVALRRLVDRQPSGVPATRITAFTGFGWLYALRRATADSAAKAMGGHLWAGKRFCELILSSGVQEAEGVYTFNTAGLELLRHARNQGVMGVLEQTIAPKTVERSLLEEDWARFPHWEDAAGIDDRIFADFVQREALEWDAADVILCGSEFVRDSVAAAGGPRHKCVVVPYGVHLKRVHRARDAMSQEKQLRVLFVGTVGLRKGVQYIGEAARVLGDRAHIRLVGPSNLTDRALETLSRDVEIFGPVPRDAIAAQHSWADVLLLPSLCEGSATVVYEALQAGLPVVCTHNTGSIVRDGVEGFIVPIRDARAIADRLERLRDPKIRAEMSEAARARSIFGGEEAYGERLVEALRVQKH